MSRFGVWALERVPRWFRSRWPLKRFYWQNEDIEAAKLAAEHLRRTLGW